ncbi:hypothetical protein ACFYZH_10035 [Streptomyces abikoensis]|uniref:hypothetical protein n=1 Tax=Streptomyces abikoensis TaxID=97398 RepID=UPI003675777C
MADQVTVTDAAANAVQGIIVSIDNGKSGADGHFTGTVTVAESVAPGTYTITVSETANSTVKASAALTVTAKPTPSVTVAPASAVQGGPAVTLAGTGFHATADLTSNATSG